ncbi:MAG: ATP-grasp domain-containing protein [Bryobacteraceae bacterium]
MQSSRGKRVLIVASTTGYQTRMFLDAAATLGYEAVLATDRCHALDDPWGDRALPLRFEDPRSCADVLAGEAAVDGIVALGDRPAYIAALIAERLTLPFHSVESVSNCRDKYLSRSKFQNAGLLAPRFFRIPLDREPQQSARESPYPCVLKPLGLSASRGVIRANDPAEFSNAVQRIHTLLNASEIRRLGDEQNRFIQVETFIPGREFALEGIVTRGKLHVIALFDKPDPLDGPFFEETMYVTPSRTATSTQDAIRHTTASAVGALGLTDGPIHAEMRVNHQGVWMLEIAARPIGGLCAKVLPDLPKNILQHAVGEMPAIGPARQAAGVMMIPIPRAGVFQNVTGVDAAKQLPGIEDVIVTAKPGEKLVPLPEGNSYLGFIFARGDHPGEVEAALRASHAELSFEIVAALHVMS